MEDTADNYGYLLRKYYNNTKSSKSMNQKSKNPKGFEEYYFKKMPSKSNF